MSNAELESHVLLSGAKVETDTSNTFIFHNQTGVGIVRKRKREAMVVFMIVLHRQLKMYELGARLVARRASAAARVNEANERRIYRDG